MPPEAPAQVWTTRTLLAWMTDAFTKAGVDSARLHGEMLLAHVLRCDRLRLYTDADRAATPAERDALRALVQRALRHEPVQYLVGEGWFFSLPFTVDRRVLIPRPATETIVERILQHARSTPDFSGPKGEGMTIADVCTGSGAVAVATIKNLAGARAVATDISPDALQVAALNASRHGVAERVAFAHGDLLEPAARLKPEGGFHVLAANPPYIPDHEWGEVAPNVKNHEPELALRGGPDGMRLAAPIIRGAAPLLRPGGLLLVEVAASCAGAALELAASQPTLADAQVLRDSEGLDRVVFARRGSSG
ncbi:MAG: peptide chain release factor N(5)-glutamine methyltransferase [Phycisphaerales bacterium]|nr:peptide chain release factor N(5)-glutamine methyltransferase [Phycisphaerales bacterium]